MKTATRIVITFCAIVAIYFFIYWLPFSMVPVTWNYELLPNIVALLVAILVGIFIWRKTKHLNHSLATSILLGGLIVGSIGFVAGFFGPLIFYPESNLGPLMGIFYTGPIGFMLGLILGPLYRVVKKKQTEPLS